MIDNGKGSFYANPLKDHFEFESSSDKTQHNVWPRAEIPELEEAFKELGQIHYDAGLQMVKHLDKFVEKRIESYPKSHLMNHLSEDSTVGRLLFYYPAEDGQDANWCGWHNDHSCITCLSSAIF